MDELNLDDVCLIVGRLSLENYKLNRKLVALQEQVTALTAQVKSLHASTRPNITVVEAAPTEQGDAVS